MQRRNNGFHDYVGNKVSKNSPSVGNNPDSAASHRQRTREPEFKSNLFFRSCNVYGWPVSGAAALSYNFGKNWPIADPRSGNVVEA
jgi:hypothetical protein